MNWSNASNNTCPAGTYTFRRLDFTGSGLAIGPLLTGGGWAEGEHDLSDPESLDVLTTPCFILDLNRY